jgi:hypothetical protein
MPWAGRAPVGKCWGQGPAACYQMLWFWPRLAGRFVHSEQGHNSWAPRPDNRPGTGAGNLTKPNIQAD